MQRTTPLPFWQTEAYRKLESLINREDPTWLERDRHAEDGTEALRLPIRPVGGVCYRCSAPTDMYAVWYWQPIHSPRFYCVDCDHLTWEATYLSFD